MAEDPCKWVFCVNERKMIIFVLSLLGLCFGSFVNALVWRLRMQESSKVKKKSNNKTNSKSATYDYSVLRGRSICPNCQHRLAPLDLLPIVSWLALKGRCRYCKKPISWQYPLVELLTAILFVVLYVFWPYTLLNSLPSILWFILWLVILTGLIALAVYDLKWLILPDKIIKPLFVIGLVMVILQLVLIDRSNQNLSQIALSTLIGGGIFWVLFQLSKGKWIGGGDVKLGFLLGLVLQKPLYAFLYIFIASILGMLYSAPMLLVKKIKPTSKVPFGPFLIIGAIVTLFFGQQIFNWYLSLLIIK